MDSVFFYISAYIICTIVIVLSGTRLTMYADKISEMTGWGKAWIGLILMASVTSLPELITGISSVAIMQEPGLAAGDVFGSCMFNLLILSMVDARIQKPLTSQVKQSHVFAGLLGIILLTVSALAIILGDTIPTFLWISPFTLIIIIIYFIAIRGIYSYEKHLDELANIEKKSTTHKDLDLKQVVTSYIINAFLVVVAAMFLPYLAHNIIAKTDLSIPFFGTLFLAASTSLPELVVSYSAIRLKAFDLLVGNLLGSNIFNIFILAIDDLFYVQGSLYSHIHIAHLQTVLMIIIMTAIVGLGLIIKPTRKFWRLSFDALLILILYIALIVYLFYTT